MCVPSPVGAAGAVGHAARTLTEEEPFMRTASIAAGAFAFGAATFAMTRSAHALGPVDLEVGAKVGLGTSPVSNDNGGPNPLGFGLGARGGVSFLGFYGGVQLMYYFGGSDDVSALGQSVSLKTHTFMYGIEAGYGITLIDVLTLRPQIGIGNATFSSSVSGSGIVTGTAGSSSDSNLYLEPGVTGLVSLGGWFVGADANLLFFPGLDNSKTAFSLHGQIGVKF
jgi:hypothetical protein